MTSSRNTEGKITLDTNHPLVVDLDGTLIRGDMMWESLIFFLKEKPFQLPKLLLVLLTQGKAGFKASLGRNFKFNPLNIPLREEVVDLILETKSSGRPIVLSTGASTSIAEKISGALGYFDYVIGSTPTHNNSGATKAKDLVQRFGTEGFDYIGNSIQDLHVWRQARKKYSVGPFRVKRKASDVIKLETKQNTSRKDYLIPVVTTLRPHQWAKNILIFLPAFASQKIFETNIFHSLLLAFISFSVVASSVYIFNDVLDLQNDRSHQTKKFRPIAAGLISVPASLLLGIALLGLGLTIGESLSFEAALMLAAYFTTSLLYSASLKKVAILDVVTLSILYTFRLVFGAIVVQTEISTWLLGFSFFLFFSLALVKRYIETNVQTSNKLDVQVNGRGYKTSDTELIGNLGVSAGVGSVIVFSLYLSSESVVKLYTSPELLWLVVPVLLTWISWVWLKAVRREMPHDPIMFAIRDKFSFASGLLILIVFSVAQNF